MPDMPPLTPGPKRKQLAKTAERGYGAAHRKARVLLLAKYPICQICNKYASSHAHHLVYPALTIDDYQALCPKCHADLHR